LIYSCVPKLCLKECRCKLKTRCNRGFLFRNLEYKGSSRCNRDNPVLKV